MTRYLKAEMPDGFYHIPANFIAASRAEYLKQRAIDRLEAENDKEAESLYNEEFYYTLNDDGELLDWAANNMNWSDVKDIAIRVAVPAHKADWEDAWCNGEHKVVDE